MAALFYILIAGGAFAAQVPGVEPGVIEKQFEAPRTPQVEKPSAIPAPLLPGAPKDADKITLHLNAVTFEGATVFSDAELQDFAKDLVGHDIKVADLFALSQKITKAYSDAGYPLAVALVPKQDITAGRVKILVYEGYVAEIEIAGDPGNARARLEAIGEKIKADRPLRQNHLERYLLIANQLPGLEVGAVLDKVSKGKQTAPGGVKLILNVGHQGLEASIGVDNRGSRALGRERGWIDLAENGLLWGSERVAIGLVQTFQTRELTYFHGTVEQTLNAEGTLLSLTGTWSRSKPGTELLRAIDFNSNGWTAALELSHPIIRRRATTLRLFGGFEFKDLSSDFGSLPNSHDKLSVFRGGMRADLADRSGGINQIDATVSQGVALFNATRAGDHDKSRANGSGQFTSFTLTLGRLQPLGNRFDLWLSATGQIASRPLLASEQCGYGGGAFGRAFDNYEIAGDQCVMGLAELRYLIAPGNAPWLKLQPFVFYDAGLVRQRGTLVSGEARQETGQSVGGGMRFGLGRHISGSVEYDQPLTREVALEGNKDGRVFFSLSVAR